MLTWVLVLKETVHHRKVRKLFDTILFTSWTTFFTKSGNFLLSNPSKWERFLITIFIRQTQCLCLESDSHHPAFHQSNRVQHGSQTECLWDHNTGRWGIGLGSEPSMPLLQQNRKQHTHTHTHTQKQQPQNKKGLQVWMTQNKYVEAYVDEK